MVLIDAPERNLKCWFVSCCIEAERSNVITLQIAAVSNLDGYVWQRNVGDEHESCVGYKLTSQ
jgi:hypothetical protein